MAERPPDDRTDTRVGTTLCGKYRLDSVVGEGSMATVYAATHRNHKRFAVKILSQLLSKREDVRQRFQRESYVANSLAHPAAVAVIDDDVTDDGSAFLVMELLDGEGVDHLWAARGKRLPVDAVLAIGDQLLDLLSRAHALGIVHRDVKPANLFLLRDGTVKVLDFGIARVRDAVAKDVALTRTGIVLGTPAFMAPEQAMGDQDAIDARTDVWAAGATLFSLLAGQWVHDARGAAQLVFKAAKSRARSLATVAPEVPLPVVALIDRALEFERDARWPSADAMRDALRETYRELYGEGPSRAPLLGLLPQATPVATAAPTPPPGVSKPGTGPMGSVSAASGPLPVVSPPRTWRVIAGASAAGVVAGLVVFWLSPSRETPGLPSGAASTTAPLATSKGAPPPSVSPWISLPPKSGEGPGTGASQSGMADAGSATTHPAPPPPPRAAAPAPRPCRLIRTVDQNGEPHFTCPCAKCE